MTDESQTAAPEFRLLVVAMDRLTTAINGLRSDLRVAFNDIRHIREDVDVIKARTFVPMHDEDTNGSNGHG